MSTPNPFRRQADSPRTSEASAFVIAGRINPGDPEHLTPAIEDILNARSLRERAAALLDLLDDLGVLDQQPVRSDEWTGSRNGEVVATFPHRYAAERALTERRVDSIAPAIQPGVENVR